MATAMTMTSDMIPITATDMATIMTTIDDHGRGKATATDNDDDRPATGDDDGHGHNNGPPTTIRSPVQITNGSHPVDPKADVSISPRTTAR